MDRIGDGSAHAAVRRCWCGRPPLATRAGEPRNSAYDRFAGAVVAVAGPDALALYSDVERRGQDHSTVAEF